MRVVGAICTAFVLCAFPSVTNQAAGADDLAILPAAPNGTSIKGFKSGNVTSQVGKVHQNRFRVIGGAPRTVLVQYRPATGTPWQTENEVITAEDGRAKVTMTASSDKAQWRVKVPRTELYRRVTSGVRSFTFPTVDVPDTSSVTGSQIAASKLYARIYILNTFGWGDAEYFALEQLWTRESGWNHLAVNPSSGATGIPQSLPGSKMASEGADWRTNPETQIRWGAKYIKARYGTPTGAWRHFQENNWY